MVKIDLNSDIGESFGGYRLGCDAELIQYVSSVNLACGFHAGDPMVMEKSVRMCAEAGVAIGAHPGFPDLMGFGRRQMKLSFEEAKTYIKYQLGALTAFTSSYGLKIQHLKAHGAFGNMALKDETLARAICTAVAEVDPTIIVMSLPGCCVVKEAEKMGLRFANEVFADRAYNEDCTLVARGTPGAMIEDPDLATKRVIRMIKEKKVTAITGKDIDIDCHTVCVHGDTPSAIEIVKKMRAALEAEGIEIANLSGR